MPAKGKRFTVLTRHTHRMRETVLKDDRVWFLRDNEHCTRERRKKGKGERKTYLCAQIEAQILESSGSTENRTKELRQTSQAPTRTTEVEADYRRANRRRSRS